jgi:hypothetical protein
MCYVAVKTQQNANEQRRRAASCTFTLQHVVPSNEANNIILACGGGNMTGLVYN